MASRIVRFMALVCILGAIAGVGWTTKTGMDELSIHTNKIDAQHIEIKRVDRELKSLDSLITVEGEKIKQAETDEERIEMKARGMQQALKIAKQQSVLDGQRTRAEKIIESREEKASVVKGRMLKWNLLFGVAAVVLAGFWMGLKKLAG